MIWLAIEIAYVAGLIGGGLMVWAVMRLHEKERRARFPWHFWTEDKHWFDVTADGYVVPQPGWHAEIRNGFMWIVQDVLPAEDASVAPPVVVSSMGAR